jgi:glycosyltransferase involved in cell wall biosynthesis
MNKKYLFNKFLNLTQHRILPSATQKLSKLRRKSFENIGKRKLPFGAPRALVINISTAIPYYLEGNVYKCPIIDNHALYWESAELVRQLNEKGYIVDFIDCNDEGALVNWQKYELIFDERNNLMFAPSVEGQKKIFYSTGLKWSFQNEQQLKRIDWFFCRTGIRIYPERYLFPNYSDEFADYQTYYGKSELMNMFSNKSIKIALDVSCTYVPPNLHKEKRILKRFVWLGGSGSIHKGLDLAVEAFRRLPDNELLIFGPAKRETFFFKWLKDVMLHHPNIQYHGYANFKDEKHADLLSSAIGNIFPSCSEGGPGSVAQAAFFGLIPIVTSTANIRYEHLGYVIENNSDGQIIDSIIEKVKTINDLSEANILEKTEAVCNYATQFHTRDAYTKSLSKFLNQII